MENHRLMFKKEPLTKKLRGRIPFIMKSYISKNNVQNLELEVETPEMSSLLIKDVKNIDFLFRHGRAV